MVGGVALMAIFAAGRKRTANGLPQSGPPARNGRRALLPAACNCGLQYFGEREEALACLAQDLWVGQAALDDGVEIGGCTLDRLDGTLLTEVELMDLRHGSGEA